MKSKSPSRPYIVFLALLLAVLSADAAHAHQPFFESPDTTASTPMEVSDPEISTALYSTLELPGDVDFFTFTVTAGQSIEIGMSIPQIEGQDRFDPTIGIIARGLNEEAIAALPVEAQTLATGKRGATLLAPTDATIFFEPFSRTAYWQRQRSRVTFPAEGVVHVVVWHPQRSVGRYTLVVGQREVLGGDFGFARKLKEYWTPVVLSTGAESGSPEDSINTPTQEPLDPKPNTTETCASTLNCSWLMRLLASLFGESERCQ